MNRNLLPDGLQPDDIVFTAGLISDTHAPQRWPGAPAEALTLFAGVDLILHAGDVGELWVLDQLADCAPVAAVHGNDETPEAQRALPYQQVIAVAGHRIFLCHSHFPDREEELAFRRIAGWEPKLDRYAAQAAAHGCDLYVLGHLHVPFVIEHSGVTLVNPGAIASGNWFTRQRVQTLALLFLSARGSWHVTHVNLAEPCSPHKAAVDLSRPFVDALAGTNESVVRLDLEACLDRLRPLLDRDRAFRDVVLRLGRRCWTGEVRDYGLEDLQAAVDADNGVEEMTRIAVGALGDQKR